MKCCKILASLLAVLLLWGCVPKHSQEMPVSTQPPTEAPTETPTEAPTEEPTQAPTEPKPEWLLHSGIREDGSFDEGTLFIGDSLTCGFLQSYLAENDLVGDAWYMAMPGAALTAFFNGPQLRYNGQYYSYFSPAFADGTMAEGVEKVGENLTAVYLMLGTNHNDGVTEQLYVDVVGYILECCPNATVYLQRIPWSTSSAVDEDAANGRIQHAYEYYVNQGEIRVRLIDTQTFIDYNLTPDGVHLTWTGQRQWYEALVGYARYHEIPQ